MILDNRQVVPDIIVSRDGVPNCSFAYNINANFNNNVGQAERIGPESPRHLSKGQSSRHAYATGNNNGSPRHAPHNGNYYSEPKVLPNTYQRSEKVINRSNSHNGKSMAKKLVSQDDSSFDDDNSRPRTYFDNIDKTPKPSRRAISPYESPIHNRYNLQMASRELLHNLDKVQNKLDSPSRKYVPKYSPVHQMHRTQNMKQGIFCSPKHLPKTSHLFSPRRVYPSYLPKEGTETTLKQGPLPPFQSETFRPRSSSHPCEGSKFPIMGQSKIPVHVVRPRTRQNSGERDDRNKTRPNDTKINVFNSPCKNLNLKHKILNTNALIRKGSAPEFLTSDPKKNENNFTTFSPKRTNFRNQNQNNVRCSTPQVQRSPRRFLDSRGWNANARECVEAKQWNGDTWRWNKEENEFLTMDCSNSWNIENEMSQEENSSSLHDVNTNSEGELNKTRNRLVSWPSLNNVKKKEDDWEEYAEGENDALSDKDSGVETDGALGSKMVLIKCKDASYLTRIFVSNEGKKN